MIIAKYDFPLPNNGNRYDISLEELIELLDAAYENGWNHAKETYQPGTITTATSYEDKDDNTKWNKEWIK